MLPTERMETSGDRPMMLQHAEGGVVFLLDAPMAKVVEITIDFGRGLIRTLGMRRNPEGCWQLRIHAGLKCLRYRYRVDGRVVPEPEPMRVPQIETPGSIRSEDPGADGWSSIRHAA